MKRRPELVEGSAGYEAAPHQWDFSVRNGAESPIHRALLCSTGTSCPCGRRLRSNTLLPNCFSRFINVFCYYSGMGTLAKVHQQILDG